MVARHPPDPLANTERLLTSIPDRLRAALADRYRIERELGQGGMATVYLAQDLKHDRLVAVKVLKPELAAVLGAERFVVEIKTTASMSHPHILPLFDSGSADGFLFYVMPFIEGETLRDKLSRETQLGIDEAVRIAREILDALEYAHARGIIHRDIKPENILLQGGRPMIADFGIALAVSAAAGGRMTETGLSLGTPHYMSPEQATAEKEITGRADVYSLASVLYEMLTGDPPHTGSSAQQIIMRIITEPAAPVTKVRRTVPPNVASAVAKALEKLPADRFESARAFSEALGNPTFTVLGTAGERAAPDAAAPAPGGRGRLAMLAVAAVAVVAAAVEGFLLFTARPPAPEVVRFELTLQEGVRLDLQGDEDVSFAISPDGKRIVFASRDTSGMLSTLHIREIGQLTSTPLPGTEKAIAPFFSPDGLWVGFATDDDKLRKVPVSGGPAITLAEDVQGSAASGSWGDDGWIIYVSQGFATSRVRGTGGTPERLNVPSADTSALIWPFVLPGSARFLAEQCTASCRETDLVLVDVATKRRTVLVPGATRGWYLPSGVLVYATSEGTVMAAPFDAAGGRMLAPGVPVLDDVLGGFLNGTRLAVSASGTMMYRRGKVGRGVQVVEVDRSGREQVLLAPYADYQFPRWSPDRDRIALVKGVAEVPQVMIYDVRSQTLSQLTTEGSNVRPSWSPDGRRLAFYSTRSSVSRLYWMPADRSAPAERVVQGEEVHGVSTTSWSRDGAWIVFDGVPRGETKNEEDLFVVGTGADRTRRLVLQTPATEQNGSISPDGRWIAYNADEGGTYQVYVRPFLREGGQWLISTGLAAQPVWASNSELIYADGNGRTLVSAKLELGATVRVLSRTPLFSLAPYSVLSGASLNDYDVSRDGQRFLLLKRPVAGEEADVPVVVLHWDAEIARRMKEQGGGAP